LWRNSDHFHNFNYFLDAYDKEKNLVVEWYEKHHFNKVGSIREDLSRVNNIIKTLQCKFIGYDYTGKKIIDESYASQRKTEIPVG